MQVLGWQKISTYCLFHISWFAYIMSVMCLLVSLVVYLFLFLMLVGERGEYLVSIVLLLFFLFFFAFLSLENRLFYLLVDRVRDSSSAGQSVTYIFILEANNRFEGGGEGLGVIRKWIFIIVYISNIFSLIFCNFYMFFRFVLVCMLVFVCLLVHKCILVWN